MKQKSFILYEVLVSILIASFVIVGIMAALSTSIKTIDVVNSYYNLSFMLNDEINRIALLEELETGVESGKKDKSDGTASYKWTMKVEDLVFNTYYGDIEYPLLKVNYKLTDSNSNRMLEVTSYFKAKESK